MPWEKARVNIVANTSAHGLPGFQKLSNAIIAFVHEASKIEVLLKSISDGYDTKHD